MFASLLEVLLNWFRPPRPGPVSTPPGGERAGQDTESLVEVDVADKFKLDVYHALLLRHEISQESYLISCRHAVESSAFGDLSERHARKMLYRLRNVSTRLSLCCWSPKRKLLMRPARYPHGRE